MCVSDNMHLYTLLGTPVPRVNHVAAVQHTKSRGYEPAAFTSTIKMENKCDLGDFDHGMIVGARKAGLCISLSALGIFTHTRSMETSLSYQKGCTFVVRRKAS